MRSNNEGTDDYCNAMLLPSTHTALLQAGNGVYELTDRVHPGGGDTFTKLCAGKGRIKGKPLKTVNWAGIGSFHPYVWSTEYRFFVGS